jgi:hypothetical protein
MEVSATAHPRRIEVIAGERRRKWSARDRRREPGEGAVVTEVACRLALNPQRGIAQTCSRAEQQERPGAIARCNTGIRSSRAAG